VVAEAGRINASGTSLNGGLLKCRKFDELLRRRLLSKSVLARESRTVYSTTR
jgi:hypothetical protein